MLSIAKLFSNFRETCCKISGYTLTGCESVYTLSIIWQRVAVTRPVNPTLIATIHLLCGAKLNDSLPARIEFIVDVLFRLNEFENVIIMHYISSGYLLLYNRISGENSNYPDEILTFSVKSLPFFGEKSSCGVLMKRATGLSQVEYLHSVRWIYLPAERIQCVRGVVNGLGKGLKTSSRTSFMHSRLPQQNAYFDHVKYTTICLWYINMMRTHESHAVHNMPSLHIIASTGVRNFILEHVIYLHYKQQQYSW